MHAAQTFQLRQPALTLESGAVVREPVAHVWWWGPARDHAALASALTVHPDDPAMGEHVVRRDAQALHAVPTPDGPIAGLADVPTVLCIHALTGDARVGGPGGWWEPLVGPDKVLDPRRMRILCINNLGSCYGSSGPADAGYPTLAEVPGATDHPEKGGFAVPEAMLPAPITTYDQARFLLATLDALGIGILDLVAGGSVGGMVALALAALAPERAPRVVPIATLDHATPWIIGWNHIGRQTIAEALAHGVDPQRALALARQVAHMTYRAGPGLMERHGRRVVSREPTPWSARSPYAVQTYLEHQGRKLVNRYDARAYVNQLDAMDHHDLGRPPPPPDAHETWKAPSTWPGLARITGRLDTVAIDSDELFFAKEIHDLVVRHRMHGHDASWHLVKSPHGHDAFLMTWDPLRAVLRAAIHRIDPQRFA